MKQSTKILLGIATIWPFIYFPFFIGAMFLIMSLAPADGGDAPPIFALIFPVIFLLHLITILDGIGLLVFYIVNVFRNERVNQDQRLMWILLLFFLGLIVMPVYWYLNIWKEPQASLSDSHPFALNNANVTDWINQTSAEQKEHERMPPPPGSWRE